MEYTKEFIKAKLQSDQRWVERAIVVIYEYQTAEEQAQEITKNDNGVGFTAFDARVLSYYAVYLKSGKHLSGKHLEKAKKTVPKYAGQLLKIIQSKN